MQTLHQCDAAPQNRSVCSTDWMTLIQGRNDTAVSFSSHARPAEILSRSPSPQQMTTPRRKHECCLALLTHWNTCERGFSARIRLTCVSELEQDNDEVFWGNTRTGLFKSYYDLGFSLSWLSFSLLFKRLVVLPSVTTSLSVSCYKACWKGTAYSEKQHRQKKNPFNYDLYIKYK